MKVGISTACLYPSYTEKAFATLVDLGVKYIEIFLNSVSELDFKFLSDIKKLADSQGVKVTSIHPFTSGIEPYFFFSNYERRFWDGIEMYRHYFEACNVLGCDILVFHGDKKESTFDHQRYFERYQGLFTAGRKQGVFVAQENVARCVSRSPLFIQQMKLSLKDEVKFVLDIKQANRAGYDFYEFIDVMGDSLYHIHGNDYTEVRDCLPPGCGQVDFASLFQRLKALNYQGCFIIELYRDNFETINNLLSCYDYVNQW